MNVNTERGAGIWCQSGKIHFFGCYSGSTWDCSVLALFVATKKLLL